MSIKKEGSIVDKNRIKDKIYTVRGLQVMFDSDLAILYEVSTKALNRAVKRNIDRFPDKFMFQLTEKEFNKLKSQFVTSSNISLRSQNVTLDKEVLRFQNGTSSLDHGGRRYLPYAFTEQGVAMLSGVLRSDTAVKISIQIMNAFVSMRKFIYSNAQIFQRLDRNEQKLLEHDHQFNKIFDLIEKKEIIPQKGIFFEGQIFDAYKFVSDIFRSAKKSIVLIDNFIDDTVLTLFSKRKVDVEVIIFTKEISKQLSLDLKKYNSQYPCIEVREFKSSHDRFLIIDDKEVFHLGASLKDLGKKWFAFSKFDKEAFNLLERLK
jgi:hypothetical protein